MNQATRTFTATYTYAGTLPGQTQSVFTVTATATDSDGGTGSASTAETVNAVAAAAPTLGSLAFTPATINEGSSTTLTGTVQDANAYAVSVVWGDGSTTVMDYAATVTSFSISHVYLDNPAGQPAGAFTATATVTDQQDGAFASAMAAVTVKNVPPAITTFTDASSAASKASAGQPLAFDLVFADPGALDTHTVTIGWGDGSKASVYTLPAGQLTFTPAHTYALPGTFYVTVQVTDKDGGVSAGKAGFAYVGAAPTAPILNLASATPAAVPPPPQAVLTTVPLTQPTTTLVTASAPAASSSQVLTVSSGMLTAARSSSGSQASTAIHSVVRDHHADAPIRLLHSDKVRIVTQPGKVTKVAPATLLFDEAEDRFDAFSITPKLGGVEIDDDWLMLPVIDLTNTRINNSLSNSG